MAGSLFKKFILLLWKNWLLQKRRKLGTFLEIFIPVLLAFVLFGLRQVGTIKYKKENAVYWNGFSVDSFDSGLVPTQCGGGGCLWRLLYTPNNTLTYSIMETVKAKLTDVYTESIDSETLMVSTMNVEDAARQRTLGGIVFNFDSTLPSSISYKIRLKSDQYNKTATQDQSSSASSSAWYTDTTYPSRPEVGPREYFGNSSDSSEYGGVPEYYLQGFLALQRQIDRAIILQVNPSADVDSVKVQMQRFPYPSFINDDFIIILQAQFPFIIMLSFLVTAPSIVKDVVLEKEKKLKETMKLMGLPNFIHWLAWFTKYFMFLLISVILMTFFFCLDIGNGAVINETQPFLVFLFLMTYATAVIFFCFVVSTFFSTASVGAAAGGILFFITYIPYFFIAFNYASLTYGAKFLACLLPNVAMALGCVFLANAESKGTGIQFSNAYEPVISGDNFTMAGIFGMLILDMGICTLIIWYVDNVKPGDFGVPKPWYFPFTKWYWCGGSHDVDTHSSLEDHQKAMSGTYHEKQPDNAEPGITILGLRKEFTKEDAKKVAVNDLHMDMIKDQITVLLGHNGAGKTTTMFMLTGFIPPTSGTAIIGGLDIRKDLDKVRSSLGLCPQHDVLFDTLTVKEHLTFFAKLKQCRHVDKEVDDMIGVLHLEAKRHIQAMKLSGGMKRKLCVGIALIGGSKTVILDEPTSGMDPEARRQCWDILQSQRKNRTILLTTHFMDEADYLGDRIAIMAEGKLVCNGSSLFLKKKFGVGYHMVMVKTDACDTNKVHAVITRFVPEAKLDGNTGAELSYVLPHESSQNFEGLFSELETNRTALGIGSFGASLTTMEEVFLKVGEGVENDDEMMMLKKSKSKNSMSEVVGYENAAMSKEEYPLNGSTSVAYVNGKSNDYEVVEMGSTNTYHLKNQAFGVTFTRNTGVTWYAQQYWGMLVKRFLITYRSPVVTLAQMAVPVFFAIIGCLVIRSIGKSTTPEALTLSFSSFTTPISPYHVNATYNTVAVGGLKTALMSYLSSVSVSATDQSSVDLKNYLVGVGEDDLKKYSDNYITAQEVIGASATTASMTGLFNNEAYHTPGIALNVIGNTLLKSLGSPTMSIVTINHPFPKPPSYQAQSDYTTQAFAAFILSYNVTFGMAFLMATFVIALIKERTVKSKHCQFISGVGVTNFWMSTFSWDLVCYLFPAIGVIIIFAAFQVSGYAGSNLGVVFLVLFMYGVSVLPFVYLLSFVFDVASTGYVWTTIVNIFTGTVAVLIVYILKIPSLDTTNLAKIFEWIFYIFLPNFCFANGLQEIYNNYQATTICNRFNTLIKQQTNFTFDEACAALQTLQITHPCCPENCGSLCLVYNDYYIAWARPGVGRAIFFMTLQFFMFFLIIFFLESGTFKSLRQRIITIAAAASQSRPEFNAEIAPGSPVAPLDSDVMEEQQHVAKASLKDKNPLVLSSLKKYYGKFLAVDGLSVGIQKGECFGLLGVNGAGKTTTFKMLTGDESVTGGDAYVCGYNVKHNIKEVQQNVGYCPQFDALIDKLTVYETLAMFARLRGVRESDIKSVVMNTIKNLLLDQFVDRQAGLLSGGNKRKLSTGIALIGDPSVIFLDEPTTGMDPVARRLLWNTLTKVRESGRTLVLTSHSMEECDALCTRLAIMVNGQFKCLGSSQHLKSKFGEGFTLTAKLTPGETAAETRQRTERLKTFIEATFLGAILKDLHEGLVMYQVKDTTLGWAHAFGQMEKIKAEYCIDDYSVSQTTLEQVFINFARAQQPPIDEDIKCTTKFKSCCCFFCGCGCCRNYDMI